MGSKRHEAFYLLDALIAIDRIERYTVDFEDGEALKFDEMAWDATIRELTVLGEVIGKIIKSGWDDTKLKNIVAFRNRLVHAYFGIDEAIVWNVIQNHLQPLKKELERRTIERLKSDDRPLDDALEGEPSPSKNPRLFDEHQTNDRKMRKPCDIF